jgi:hypothetical protein
LLDSLALGLEDLLAALLNDRLAVLDGLFLVALLGVGRQAVLLDHGPAHLKETRFFH